MTIPKEPIYCSLAFGSVSLDGSGYKPCCNFQAHTMFGDRNGTNLNDDGLIKVREILNRGEWPLGCKTCKEMEEQGNQSMRTIWNTTFKHHFVETKLPTNTTVDPKNVQYLDLTFSNKCNSKCMTCSSSLSNLWGEEWESIWGDDAKFTGGISKTLTKENNYLKTFIDHKTVDHLIETYPNVKRIAFVGGEPTIHEDGLRMCEELIRLDRAKDIDLSYVTNLTNLDDRLLDIWQQFKSINLSVSIDGYGKVNEYIRYPIKWNKVESHVRQMFETSKRFPKKYNISLSHTVSLLNITSSCELLEWWWDLIQFYNQKYPKEYNFYSVFLNKVWAPEHLKTNLLTKEFRETSLESLNKLEQKVKSQAVKKDSSNNMLDQLSILRSWMTEKQVFRPIQLETCLTFIEKSDAFRNRSIKDYLPVLHQELTNMNKISLTHEGKGYDQIKNIIPRYLIDSINSKKDVLYPVRASTHKKEYAEGDACKKLFGIAVWWSQLTDDWHEVQEIDKLIRPEIIRHMPNAQFYASDIVTINGPSRWVSPHVDTPHRFERYNTLAFHGNHELLGIQVIIPLDDIDKDTGATGLVPNSHRQDWDINDCYNGVYDDYFKQNAIQLDMPVGSILFYNTRLMHSTMPLNLPKKRSILLINYLRGDIIKTVSKIDNVWTSNGK